MALQWKPPFQIDPYARGPEQQSLDALNNTMANMGQQANERRRLALSDKYASAAEKRAQQEHYEKYGDPNWRPEDMTPQGPNPPGTVEWGGGEQGPQPPSTLTDQFLSWRQKSQAKPMDTYMDMVNDPRAGSNRRSSYLTAVKEGSALEKEQSEIEKNRAQASMYGAGGAGAGNVEWKQSPFDGQFYPYPKKLGAGGYTPSAPGATPVGGPPKPLFSTPPAMPGAPGGGPPPTGGRVGNDPMAGLDYKTRLKRQAELPKARGSAATALREYDNMIREAEGILNADSLDMASGMSSWTTKIPGTPMRNVQANMKTLQAKTLLNVLTAMKELSQTGASGFGALSELEGENIRNSVASLDLSQGTPALKANIGKFVADMKQKRAGIKNTFRDTYGEDLPDPAPGGGTPPPAGAPAPGGADTAGKIKVSNGTETMWIDPADAQEAAQDGFNAI